MTLGIQPTRPDTGYGYIQYEDPHDEAKSDVRPVKTFTEKPDLATAETFLASGEFCWNSGIFVWSLSNIHAAFEQHLPDMLAEFADADLDNPTELNAVYGNCENISIDYGIMEKGIPGASRVVRHRMERLGDLGQPEGQTRQRRPRQRHEPTPDFARWMRQTTSWSARPAQKGKNSWPSKGSTTTSSWTPRTRC